VATDALGVTDTVVEGPRTRTVVTATGFGTAQNTASAGDVSGSATVEVKFEVE
jgi:hypothetical protein